MSISTLALGIREIAEEQYSRDPVRQQILDQLDRMVADPHFRNSKRYPALLSYIVREVVAGRSDALKERTLGIQVFDRTSDYDTNADPVVRVTAGEVRKRLAQYYQAPGHAKEVRIELPIGSYMPRFYWPETPAALPDAYGPEPDPSGRGPQPFVGELNAPRLGLGIRLGALFCAVLIVLLAALLWLEQKPGLGRGQALLWQPLLQSPEPVSIVLGVHSFDQAGNDISMNSHVSHPLPEQTLLTAMTKTDMVHLSDVNSYGTLVRVLSDHGHEFRTLGASDTTFEQLRQGPFVLVGGFNNMWTMRLTPQLRYRLITLDGGRNVLQDRDHTDTIWTLDTSASALGASRDYGIVTRFLDPETDQQVLLIAGIGRSGTEAAGDFASTGHLLEHWMRSIPPQTGSNVEIVLSTDVIDGKHGPPHVMAYNFW